MTEVSPGRAAYEGMVAHVAAQPGTDPCSRWDDLQPWQRERWEAAEEAAQATAKAERDEARAVVAEMCVVLAEYGEGGQDNDQIIQWRERSGIGEVAP